MPTSSCHTQAHARTRCPPSKGAKERAAEEQKNQKNKGGETLVGRWHRGVHLGAPKLSVPVASVIACLSTSQLIFPDHPHLRDGKCKGSPGSLPAPPAARDRPIRGFFQLIPEQFKLKAPTPSFTMLPAGPNAKESLVPKEIFIIKGKFYHLHPATCPPLQHARCWYMSIETSNM